MATNFLFSTLDRKEFNRVTTCTSVKEIWNLLKITYERILQVKESNIYILFYEYEMVKMANKESFFLCSLILLTL